MIILFERQRLLLNLLDAVGEPVGDTDFQRLLFLYTQEGEAAPSYEFVPGKLGAFSFTSGTDKQKLIEAGLLVEDDQDWNLTKAGRAEAQEAKVECRMMNAEWRDKAAQGQLGANADCGLRIADCGIG